MTTVTSNDGTHITYDKLGEGPPLILVGVAFNTRTFGPNGGLAPLLAERFTVINYDRRGRGDSTDTAPYAVEREIGDIEALIEEADGSAYVFGISSGAALALEAANRGLALDKLALYESLSSWTIVVPPCRTTVCSGWRAWWPRIVGAMRPGCS